MGRLQRYLVLAAALAVFLSAQAVNAEPSMQVVGPQDKAVPKAVKDPPSAPGSCPDFSPELWASICETFEQPKPGDIPYSIDYCCRHYQYDFHKICSAYGLKCSSLNFKCKDARHAINVVEDPPGVCFLVDVTGGSVTTSPVTFACKDLAPRQICALYGNPGSECTQCKIERLSEQPIHPVHTEDSCISQVRNMAGGLRGLITGVVAEPAFEICRRCCHLQTANFWRITDPPQDQKRIAAQEVECIKSCADEFEPKGFSADLGMWYGYDKCLQRHKPWTSIISLGPLPYGSTAAECLACCSEGAGHAGQPNEYPSELEGSCRKTCKEHLGDAPEISPVSPAPKACSSNCVECCKQSATVISAGSASLRDAAYSLCFKGCSCPGGSNLPVGEPRFGKNPPCNGGRANMPQR